MKSGAEVAGTDLVAPLLKTKLQAPGCPRLVVRENLIEALSEGLSLPLTLVYGPAGSGKTMLVAQWRASEERERSVAWLSLDAGDNREAINDVAYIGQIAESMLPDGLLFEVAVIHHTQCGAGALADDAFRRRYAERIGVEESTLRERAVLDPAVTVARDVGRLRSAPAISPRVTVSGHVYDVVTGLVETVLRAGGEPGEGRLVQQKARA